MSRISSDTINLFKENKPDQGDSLFLTGTLEVFFDTNINQRDSSSAATYKNNAARIPEKPLFVQHNLQAQNPQPVYRLGFNTDWISALLIACFILLAFAKVFYNKRLEQIFYSFFSIRFQNIMQRDKHIFKDRISIPLFLVYTISLSLFINLSLWHFFPSYQFPLERIQLFFLIAIAVMALGIIKILLMLLYGMLFKSHYIRSEVIVINFVFNIVFGILLLPILILAIYIPSSFFLYSGFFLWLFVLVYKILRQIIIRISDTKFSLFNRFIYLCTFEIAPALVLIKLILNELQ